MNIKKQYPNMINELKAEYPKNTRVMCDSMNDPYAPVPSGTKGTVTAIDSLGTIHVKWDNRQTLGLIYGVDSFHKITSESEA